MSLFSRLDRHRTASVGKHVSAGTRLLGSDMRRRLRIEPLESRELLTVANVVPGDDTAGGKPTPAVELAALQAFHGPDLTGKDGPLEKIGFDLGLLYQEHLAFESAAGDEAFAASNPHLQLRDDRVAVDVGTVGAGVAMQQTLAGLGLTNSAAAAHVVSGYLPIDQLQNLASLAGVQFARPTFKPQTHAGAVSGQGDVAMRSDDARTMLGVDGSGIRIGVLSDSYDTGFVGSAAADIASGDLPAAGVTVLQESPFGTDEGRAMLQIVHDVAPGSPLSFATAFEGGEAGFANNIRALAAQGAQVIVDDVFYFSEPFFQDGLVAQAVDDVRDQGIPYFSSAGNSGTGAYQSAFADTGIAGPDGGTLHDFDPGPGVDTQMQFTLPFFSFTRFALQWDEAFGTLGSAGAANDLDIFIYGADGTTIVAGSFSNNIGRDPFEFSGIFNPGDDLDNDSVPDETFFVSIARFSGAAPGLMRLLAVGGSTFDEFATNSSTNFGHSNADGAVGVAASAFFMTPEFGITPPRVNEFSSLGGTPILFDTAGARLSAPIDRLRPQIAGPDGVNTTFFGSDIPQDSDTRPNFFGTSAAAPHVAAVAALMMQAAGGAENMPPDRVITIMQNTAIEIGTISNPFTFPSAPVAIPGPAGYDAYSGSGLIDALAAVDASKVPLVSIGDVMAFEGDSGATNFVFTVTLSEVGRRAVMIDFSTANGTATAPVDYVSQSGVVTFAPGVLSQQITIAVNGDETVEPNETFFVTLSNPLSAAIDDGQGLGTILNEDVPPPAIYVGDVTITQTSAATTTATFTIALSSVSTKVVTVNYATDNGSAVFGSDYTTTGGLLNFAPGVLTQTVTVPVAANTAGESSEFFKLLLSNPTRGIIADAQGIATIVNNTPDPTERIVDNGDGGFNQSGTWSLATNLTSVGLDYSHSAGGVGQDRSNWSIDNLAPGEYQVYTRWVPFANRATDAPYTIYDDAHAMATMRVDQTRIPSDAVSNGVNWKSLGSFNITSGTLNVLLTDNANGYVTADAVRVVRGPAAAPAADIDVEANSVSIVDGDTTPGNSDNTDFGFAAATTGSVSRTFTIRNQGAAGLRLTGSPKVQITGPSASDFRVIVQPTTNVDPISGSTTFTVQFAPTAAGLRTATISIASNDADEATYDFAIQGTATAAGPTEQIVDDGGSGYSQSGSWQTSNNTTAYQGDYRSSAAGSGGDRATWSFSNVSPGVYQVFTRWVAFSNRATNAPFTISDGPTEKNVVLVNQQQFPDDVSVGGTTWDSLGSYAINSGSLRVSLSDNANNFVAADAVRIVRVGDLASSQANAAVGPGAPLQASAAPGVLAQASSGLSSGSAATTTDSAGVAAPSTNSSQQVAGGLPSRLASRQRGAAHDRALSSSSLLDGMIGVRPL